MGRGQTEGSRAGFAEGGGSGWMHNKGGVARERERERGENHVT